jgi:hypothetical protein
MVWIRDMFITEEVQAKGFVEIWGRPRLSTPFTISSTGSKYFFPLQVPEEHCASRGTSPARSPRTAAPTSHPLFYFFYFFILRLGARGLRPKDEKESKKVETVTAAKETRKHTSK